MLKHSITALAIAATFTTALPAVADQRSTNVTTPRAAFERAVRDAGLVPNWSQPDGNRARAFLKEKAKSAAASTAGKQVGRVLGLGRNAGWLGVGAQLFVNPKVAE